MSTQHKLALAAASLGLLFLLNACAPAAAPTYEPMAEEPAMEPIAEGDLASADVAGADIRFDRMMVRTGTITIYAMDVRETRSVIENTVGQWAGQGAFVVSSNQTGLNETARLTMQIRVPIRQFDPAMELIAAQAAPETEIERTDSADDITEEYYDLEARLETLERSRDRLLELIEQSNNTDAVVRAEQLVTEREAEINAMQARMNYLSQSADLSLITVNVYTYIPPTEAPVASWRPGEIATRAWADLTGGLKDVAGFLIYFAIAVLPWLVLLGLIGYGGLRVYQAIQKRSPTP